MGADIELWIYSVAFGGAVFAAIWFLVRLVQTARIEGMEIAQGSGQTSSVFIRLLRPVARQLGFLLGSASARIEMRLGRDSSKSLLLSTRIRIQKALHAAGRPDGLSPDEFLGLIAVYAVLGLLVGALLYWRVRLGVFPLATTLLFGYLPIYRIRGLKKARQRQMKRLLPYAIDLLSLSVAAGLDFTEAIDRIVSKVGHSPLSAEFGEMLRQIRLGKSRSEALRDLGRRVELPELHSVVSALVQTDELGGNLGPILRAQANQLRIERSQYAEKLAMQAPVKILFPLIFFIFPTIFIMIFGPIALKLLTKS